MLAFQTVYPYGPNEGEDDKYMAEKEGRAVGNQF